MKKAIKNVLLIILAVAMLAIFAGCKKEAASGSDASLQVNTIKIIPTAYKNEAYDLRDVILMEEGVSYSATACYIEYSFDASKKTYSRNEQALEVKDLCFTPTVKTDTVVTITATKGTATAKKVILVPTTVRADPLDELYQSSGLIGGADNGITKTINLEPTYIQGENSASSLHVEFNTVDPHAFGNTFMDLGNEHAQKIFTDQVWDNAIVTFWIYNPMEKPIEFQLAIMDDTHEIMTDWSPADGPHRQFAKPGEWTQIFFSLRAMGTKHRLTNSETSKEYLSIKMQYEDYNLETAYTYDFYLDNLDVVPASTYPDINTVYTMSDETLEQGWENMIMDIGWQGANTIYDYEEMMGEESMCSLKATFPGEKGRTNSFICLSPEAVEELNGNLDMTGGKLSAYFKFVNVDTKVSVDIVNKAWQVSNQEDMQLKSLGNGWYYGELDLESLQVGTGRNDNIIRIRFTFHGVNEQTVVYMDSCKFEYKHVDKVLESPSVDLINMSPDIGDYYCNVTYTYETNFLQGANSVRAVKLVAPAGEKGRFTWNTDAAATNGEISGIPNMTKGTLGAWFYFGKQAPEASLQVTSDNWKGSREIFFTFTKKGSDGWYYGELHGSDISFYETANAKKILRWTLIIPAGSTVYVDNLSWKANVENALVQVDTPKPEVSNVQFAAGEDKTIELTNTDKLETLSFDYKLTSGEKLSVALMPNWENYYGYFDLTNAGCDVEGTSTQTLENGYIRVTFQMKALGKVFGAPTTDITMLYIRGEFTDASGVIENITWIVDDGTQTPDVPEQPDEPDVPVEPEQPENPEYSFTAGQDMTIELSNTDKLETLSFDYKLTTGEKLSVALMPNWENYYGYFDLTNAGCDVEGTSTQELENRYIRVTFQMNALGKVFGAPTTDITMLYIRGEFTDASGVIENITWIVDDGTQTPDVPEQPDEPDVPVEPEQPEDPEYSFTAGQDMTIELSNTDKLETLSFDYKLTSGEKLSVALMPNWENYYGYFDLTNAGCDVEGTSTQELENGYIRVTFQMKALGKVFGAPTTDITMLYIRGEFTDASGVIENITWIVDDGTQTPDVPEQPDEPDVPVEPEQPEDPEYSFTAGQDMTIELSNTDKLETLSFDYKLTSGEKLSVALMPNWENYYGYFDLTNAGCDVEGTSTQELENGYIRVTFQMNALGKVFGTPTTDISFLYIRGAYTEANGYIENISWSAETDEPQPDQTVEGANIVANQNVTILLDNTKELLKLSFDYKLETGEKFSLGVMPNWENYFGLFDFNQNGPVDPYDGITSELLENGYIRVTFDLEMLTKYSGNPGTAIEFLYINGGYTDADGEITNICLYWDMTSSQTLKRLTSMPAFLQSKNWLQKWLEEESTDEQP